MDQKAIVLAAFAPAQGGTFSPVQAQKLLFLIDRNIPQHVDGPHFNFQPYDYGPFDSSVYGVLDRLALEGLVDVIDLPGRSWKQYRLTDQGQAEGNKLLASIPDEKIRDYIASASSYVRKLSFTQLVSSIYKAYPDMKVNSVFEE